MCNPVLVQYRRSCIRFAFVTSSSEHAQIALEEVRRALDAQLATVESLRGRGLAFLALVSLAAGAVKLPKGGVGRPIAVALALMLAVVLAFIVWPRAFRSEVNPDIITDEWRDYDDVRAHLAHYLGDTYKCQAKMIDRMATAFTLAVVLTGGLAFTFIFWGN